MVNIIILIIIMSLNSNQQERKRDSSNCSYTDAGKTNYGIIQKFCFSPPIIIIKLYKTTGSSLLRTAGDPCRDRLREYAKHDMLIKRVLR